MQQLIGPVVFLLLAGCASYEPAKHPDLKASSGADSNEIVVTTDFIEVHLVPLFGAKQAGAYLGINPVRSKIMPIILRVVNTSDGPVRVELQDSFLQIGTDERWRTLSLTEAIDRALRSDAHVVGWTIAFGMPAWLIAADQATATNQTLEQDYHTKYFKPTLINVGGTGQGVVFFDVPQKRETRVSSATIRLRKLNGDQPIEVRLAIEEDVLSEK